MQTQNVVDTQQSGILSFLRSRDNYDPDRLAADEQKLRRFYLERGYADFQVISAIADLDRERNTFFITFTMEEGDRYRFGAIEVDSVIDSIWEKTSAERRSLIKNCEMNCMAVVSGIVRDAVASEDLTLPETMTPEDLVFGLWSISLGAHSIIASSDSLLDLGVQNPDDSLMFHINQLLDSFDWKPLATEFEYSSLEPRIDREVLSQS